MKTINAATLHSLIKSSDKIVLDDGEIPFYYCELSESGKTIKIVFAKLKSSYFDDNAKCELSIDEFLFQIVQDGNKITITKCKNPKDNCELTLFKLVPIEELP